MLFNDVQKGLCGVCVSFHCKKVSHTLPVTVQAVIKLATLENGDATASKVVFGSAASRWVARDQPSLPPRP